MSSWGSETSLRSEDNSVGTYSIASEVPFWDLPRRVIVAGGHPLPILSLIDDSQVAGIIDGKGIEGGNFSETLTDRFQDILANIKVKPLLREDLHNCTCDSKVEVDVVEVRAGAMWGGKETIVVEPASADEDLLDVGHIWASLGARCCNQEVSIVGLAFHQRRLVAEQHLYSDGLPWEVGILNSVSKYGWQRLVEW